MIYVSNILPPNKHLKQCLILRFSDQSLVGIFHFLVPFYPYYFRHPKDVNEGHKTWGFSFCYFLRSAFDSFLQALSSPHHFDFNYSQIPFFPQGKTSSFIPIQCKRLLSSLSPGVQTLSSTDSPKPHPPFFGISPNGNCASTSAKQKQYFSPNAVPLSLPQSTFNTRPSHGAPTSVTRCHPWLQTPFYHTYH